ncbi:biotin carboxyl carrier protein [Faunimonas pinastri]|uniref:Biotin carboxyl carrier protein of acetyl-CoA carboxylase n=1 Tax=Faunimonas pinastri TaxID=1855383 RepID=A0A1H9JL36_9HYPH|nr:acetyl-CoA carboxylase biotin carboxyl carrier protein [Faunimonas pinastri]SEQ87458.1 biotin carboxyl carrier protein [Faunimonas pinastri]
MADKKQSVDKELIRDLASLLNETDLTEIEVEQDNLRIRVSRMNRGGAAPQMVYAGAPPASAPAAASPAAAAPAADPARHPGMVPSPMVGTLYRASAPGSKPFVEVGDTVKEGQTILIVEAMKHMNEVASPRSGKITSILVDDGQPVEYGEPLMIIE